MNVKICDAIKSCYEYGDKLFHPRLTVSRGLMALRKVRPPIFLRFKRIDCFDRLNIPVYFCKTGKKAEEAYPPNWAFRHESCGKGRSSIQSRASALMELLERFGCYSFMRNKKNFLTATLQEMKNRKGPQAFPLLAGYGKNIAARSEFEKAPLKWVRSFSLADGKNILFPLGWFANTTNGFASGNCIEEAIMQGICECVERHMILAVVGKKLKSPTIKISSITNIHAKKMISKFNHAGIKLFIKDFSCGFKIPTVGVLAYDSKGPESVRFQGAAGTSPNKDIALIRALTEVAQHRAQTLFSKEFGHTWGFPGGRKLNEVKHLIDCNKSVDFCDLPTCSNNNLKTEIRILVGHLKKKGFETVVTDVTHPVMKIPTVIITVPGIEIPGKGPYLFSALCDRYAQNKNLYKATILLKELKTIYPGKSNEELKLLCGFSFERRGKFNHAIMIYDKLISTLHKNNKEILTEAYKALMRCYLSLKKTNKAFAIHQKLDKLFRKK